MHEQQYDLTRIMQVKSDKKPGGMDLQESCQILYDLTRIMQVKSDKKPAGMDLQETCQILYDLTRIMQVKPDKNLQEWTYKSLNLRSCNKQNQIGIIIII